MHYKKIVPGVLSVLAVWVLSMQITNALYEEELLKAAKNGDLQTVTNYISKGADVNSKDYFGATALMSAAYRGFTEIVKILIEHGADVNARDHDGNTALDKTPLNPQNGKKMLEIAKLLLEHGADVNSKDRYGATALSYAAGAGFTEMVKLLLKYGADINAKSYGGYPPGIEAAGEKIALMHAAARGHIETVNVLLEHGADVNAKNEYGKTASKLASERGHKEIAKLLKSYEEGCVIA